MNAVMELERRGYAFTPTGESLRFRYVGSGIPPAEVVKPLLDELKARKAEAISFLRARTVLHDTTSENVGKRRSVPQAPTVPASATVPTDLPASVVPALPAVVSFDEWGEYKTRHNLTVTGGTWVPGAAMPTLYVDGMTTAALVCASTEPEEPPGFWEEVIAGEAEALAFADVI